MFNKPLRDITRGISSLYTSQKKRKHSEIIKKNDINNNKDKDISSKFKDLWDKFKDLDSLYEELEDQLQDVHFMNLREINNYHSKGKTKNRKYTSVQNSQKNFNYNYNNLNDFCYSLYKKVTNKKQKTSGNEKEGNKIKKDVRALYNMDNKISMNFTNLKLNDLDKNSSEKTIDVVNIINVNGNNSESIMDGINNNNMNNSNTKLYTSNTNLSTSNTNMNTSNTNMSFSYTNVNSNSLNDNTNVNSSQTIISKSKTNPRLKKHIRHKNYTRNKFSSTVNNFIPSGIKIPKTFENNQNIVTKDTNIKDGNDGNNHEKNKDTSDQLNNKRMKSITSHLKDLSLNTTSGRSSGSFFNNLDRNSFNLSNNNIINNNIKNRKEMSNNNNNINNNNIIIININDNNNNNNNIINNNKNRKTIPYISKEQSLEPLDYSKSQILEAINDFVEEDINEENNNLTIHSTCSKLQTIPYDSFQTTQNEILNIMNENKSKINYIKLFSSRSFQTSSSDFIINSSSESLKDKSEYILWNKNINLSNFNNKNYQLNNEYSEEEESDPFESISDLTVSSDEREQHSFINKINKKSNSPNERHTNKSSKEKKNHDRTRNSSNISLNSNSTFTSTITTETNTTNASNITSETDNYQDNITYAELLNNPMKKYEIYQMEKSHNQLMKSWLSFETKIHSNLNKFIKNDFIDLYDYLCQKSDTINSNGNKKTNEIPLP